MPETRWMWRSVGDRKLRLTVQNWFVGLFLHGTCAVDLFSEFRLKPDLFIPLQDRQIQLIRELLVTEGSSNSIQLNEEQRSALAFLNARSQNPTNLNTSRR